jgi:hypothetical protein
MTDKKHLLSKEPRQAVEEMIKITEELAARIEIESNAVAVNDGTTFTMNEMNKEAVADMYHQAAAEFQERLEEFRQVDKALIRKLEAAQNSLGESTKNNLALLEKLQPENDDKSEDKAE